MYSNECQTTPVHRFGSAEICHLSNENSIAHKVDKLTAGPDFRPSSASPCLLAQTSKCLLKFGLSQRTCLRYLTTAPL